MADDDETEERGPKKRGRVADRPSKGARRVDDPKRPQPTIRVDDGTGGTPGVLPELDLDLIEDLAGIGCSFDEIAGCLKITRKAWEYRVSHDPAVRMAWEWGRADMKETIRRHIWRNAEGTGSAALQAALHLAKHHLGETDKAADKKLGIEDSSALNFDIAKLDRLTTEEKVLFAGIFAKLFGDNAGGAEPGRDTKGPLH
jgi:hypothetical protein